MKKFIINIIVVTTVFISILTGEKVGLLLFITNFSIFIYFLFTKNYSLNLSPALRTYFGIVFVSSISLLYCLDLQLALNVYWKILAFLLFLIISESVIKSLTDIIYFGRQFFIVSSALALYNIIFYEASVNFRELAYGGTNPVAFVMLISTFIIIWYYNVTKKKIFFLLLPIILYCMLLTASQKVIVALFIVYLFFVLINFLKGNFKASVLGLGALLSISLFCYYILISFKNLEKASFRTINTIKSLALRKRIDGAAGGVLESGGLRDDLVVNGMKYFYDAPFFGYGVNNYRILNGRDFGLFTYSHNTFIELLVGVGILGLLFYIILYFRLLKLYFKIKSHNRKSINHILLGMLISTIFINFYMELYFNQVLGSFLIIYLITYKFKNVVNESF